MALSEQGRKILWGKSGGFCPVCHESITNLNAGKIEAQQAHIEVKKTGFPKQRQGEKSKKELDSPNNILLTCGRCHNKTDRLSIEEMQELKAKHETYVYDVLNGYFNPKEFGKGRYFTKNTIYYEANEIPFNKKKNKLALYISIVLLPIITWFYINKEISKLDNNWVSIIILVTSSIAMIVLQIINIKRSPSTIQYQGKCLVEGCNGTVVVQSNHPHLKHSIPIIGICSSDITHQYSVSSGNKRGTPLSQVEVPVYIKQ